MLSPNSRNLLSWRPVRLSSMPVLNLRIIRISSASLLTGLMIGAVGGIFRMLLVIADRMREGLVVKRTAGLMPAGLRRSRSE